jgi:starch-binding outer membrane protein, SusD/RagB family
VQRKRWNQLPDYKQNYSHTIDGKTYTITPESTLWIFPFPTSVTSINSLVKQNF